MKFNEIISAGVETLKLCKNCMHYLQADYFKGVDYPTCNRANEWSRSLVDGSPILDTPFACETERATASLAGKYAPMLCGAAGVFWEEQK